MMFTNVRLAALLVLLLGVAAGCFDSEIAGNQSAVEAVEPGPPIATDDLEELIAIWFELTVAPGRTFTERVDALEASGSVDRSAVTGVWDSIPFDPIEEVYSSPSFNAESESRVRIEDCVLYPKPGFATVPHVLSAIAERNAEGGWKITRFERGQNFCELAEGTPQRLVESVESVREQLSPDPSPWDIRPRFRNR